MTSSPPFSLNLLFDRFDFSGIRAKRKINFRFNSRSISIRLRRADTVVSGID